MATFMNFLQYECIAIEAFIDEVGHSEFSAEYIHTNVSNLVARFPELNDYFEMEAIEVGLTKSYSIIDANLPELHKAKNGLNRAWSRSLRLMIIEH